MSEVVADTDTERRVNFSTMESLQVLRRFRFYARRYRKTQGELGRAVGVSGTSIGNWMTSTPSATSMGKIETFLQTHFTAEWEKSYIADIAARDVELAAGSAGASASGASGAEADVCGEGATTLVAVIQRDSTGSADVMADDLDLQRISFQSTLFDSLFDVGNEEASSYVYLFSRKKANVSDSVDIYYVGSGTGDRFESHCRDARLPDSKVPLHQYLRFCFLGKKEPIHGGKIWSGLTRDAAFALEYLLIESLLRTAKKFWDASSPSCNPTLHCLKYLLNRQHGSRGKLAHPPYESRMDELVRTAIECALKNMKRLSW